MIFLLKTNMIETKGNFKGKYHPNNLKCELCEKTEETTQHLFEYEGYTEIRRNILVKNTPKETLKENNMAAMAEVLEKIIEKRKSFMEEKNVAHLKDKMSKTSTTPLITGLSPPDGGR